MLSITAKISGRLVIKTGFLPLIKAWLVIAETFFTFFALEFLTQDITSATKYIK